MINADKKYLLNRMNSMSQKVALGDLVHNTLGLVVGTYSFARDGGAVGDYNLKDPNTGLTVQLPSGAIVRDVFCVATAALTSGGSATVDLEINAANDILAAEAVASFTLGAKIQGIPDFGTLADSITLTAQRNLKMSVNTAALTDGALSVYVSYVLAV